MPQYDFKNKETGEVTEVLLRISEYDQWIVDNPEWVRYFPASSAPKIVSGIGNLHSKVPDGFKDVLSRVKKGSSKGNTIRK